jgi:hypothetical protein
MSIRAMNWAMDQATGDPRSQCLLYVIADCANPDGVAWPSVKYMAAKSQQSKATTQRRLKELEEMGAIARFPRWEDEDGKVNLEGRGRRTSDEIRCLLDHKVDRSQPDHDGEVSADETSAPPSQPDTPPSQADTPPVAQLCDGPPSHCSGPYRNRNSEPKDSPPNPPPGGVGPAPDGWKEFEEAYPGPILRQSYARNAFTALNAIERELATKAARGYGLWIKAQRKPPNVLGAHLFLKERDAWGQYVEQSETVSQRRSVPADCDEARAYAGLRRVYLASPPRVASDGTVSLPRPLTAAEMAFADLPPPSQWVFISQRNQQGSWAGFLAEALPGIARRPLVDHHDGHADVGFFAPWPWPPLKDGSLCTGPPAAA